MLTPIYYDSRIHDIEKIKPLIEALIKGEATSGTGARLEKLRNHNVYSLRINGKGRILFTYSQIKKTRSLVVLEVLENHEYHQAKFLRKNVLKKYLEKNQTGIEGLIQDENFEDTAFPEDLKHPDANINFEAVYEHKQSYLLLDETQQTVFRTQTPFLIEGPPGSGKTTLAQTLIKQALEREQSVLYVTPSKNLARAVLRELRACPEYDADKVRISSYDDLQEAGVNSNGKALFKEWFANYLSEKREPPKKKAALNKRIDEVYEELKIISGSNKAVYTSAAGIGQKQSLIGHEQRDRKWLFTVYQAWINHLKNKQINLSEFGLKQGETNKYDFIVVDESQYLAPNQLQNLLNMANNNNVVFCYDHRQNPNDEKQNVTYLKNLLAKYSNGKVQKIQLSAHYRCPRNVMNFAAVFNDIRVQIETQAKQKSEARVVQSIEEGGRIQWFEPNDKEACEMLRAMSEDPNVCVVAPAAFKQEAFEKYGITEIFTPEEVVGLEYGTVILYKTLSTDKMKKVNQWLNKATLKHTEVNNSKADLSACFLAATRCTNRLIMVQDSKEHAVGNVIHKLKANMPKEDIESPQQDQASWERRAFEAFERDDLERARTILISHLKMTPAAAQEKILAWQEDDRIEESSSNKKINKEQPVQPTKKVNKKQSDRPRQISRKNTKKGNPPSNNSKLQNDSDATIASGKTKPIFRAETFSTPITDNDKSTNLLWNFSKAAYERGDRQTLLDVLISYPGQFSREDFTTPREGNGPDSGKSALWWIAAIGSGQSECMTVLLDQYKDIFKAEDFTMPAKSTGCTPLHYLANAAIQANPTCLMTVLEKYTFKATDFAIQITGIENKGESPLWLLCFAAAARHSEPLLCVLKKYKIEAQAFGAQTQAEGKKGIPALLWLANAALANRTEALKFVLANYPKAFKPQYFLYIVQEEGKHKGSNALSILIKLANATDNSECLDLVLAQYPTLAPLANKYQVTLESTNAVPQPILDKLKNLALEKKSPEHLSPALTSKDKSMINLSEICRKTYEDGEIDAVLDVLKKHAFEANDFTQAQASKDNKEGVSPLWLLTFNAPQGNSNLLMAVLDKYHFDSKAFTAQAQTGKEEGVTPLLLLAGAALNGYPQGMKAVLNKYPKAFSFEDFIAPAKNGLNLGQNAFICLVKLAAKGNSECFDLLTEQYPEFHSMGDYYRNIYSSGNPQNLTYETSKQSKAILNQFQNMSLKDKPDVSASDDSSKPIRQSKQAYN